MKEMNHKESMPHKGHREITHMEFRPAKGSTPGKGTLISETHVKTHRGGQGGGPSYDMHSEEMPHTSMHHAMQHLKKTYGGVFGNPPADKETDSMPEEGERPADMKDSDVE